MIFWIKLTYYNFQHRLTIIFPLLCFFFPFILSTSISNKFLTRFDFYLTRSYVKFYCACTWVCAQMLYIVKVEGREIYTNVLIKLSFASVISFSLAFFSHTKQVEKEIGPQSWENKNRSYLLLFSQSFRYNQN